MKLIRALILTLLLGCTDNKSAQPVSHAIEGSLLDYTPDEAALSQTNKIIGEWSMCASGTDSTYTTRNVCLRIIFKEYGLAEVINAGGGNEQFYWHIRNDTLYISHPPGEQNTTFGDEKYTFEFTEEGKSQDLRIIAAKKYYYYLGRQRP